MTQGTGLPAGRRRSAPLDRLVSRSGMILLAVLSATLIAAPVVSIMAAPAEPDAGPSDPLLGKSLESIAAAFRAEKADPIASLIPPDGKAYVLLTSVGGSAGYYSRDQVYFIFNRVFTQHDTTKFSIRKQKKENQGKEFVYCVGDWSYHRHDGVDGSSQIHFVLSMRKGSWALVEIREAQ